MIDSLRRRLSSLEAEQKKQTTDPESPARIRAALIELGQPAPDLVPGELGPSYIARIETPALKALTDYRVQQYVQLLSEEVEVPPGLTVEQAAADYERLLRE